MLVKFTDCSTLSLINYYVLHSPFSLIQLTHCHFSTYYSNFDLDNMNEMRCSPHRNKPVYLYRHGPPSPHRRRPPSPQLRDNYPVLPPSPSVIPERPQEIQTNNLRNNTPPINHEAIREGPRIQTKKPSRTWSWDALRTIINIRIITAIVFLLIILIILAIVIKVSFQR